MLLMYVMYSDLFRKLCAKFLKVQRKDKRQEPGVRNASIEDGGSCVENANFCKVKKKEETTHRRGISNKGFVKMKRNKSSVVIPLRPHISDAKEEQNRLVYCLV